MKIDLIGAGAMGLLLAGKLAAAGDEVRIWCRSEAQAQQLAEQGLTVYDGDGGAARRLTGEQFRAAPAACFADRWLAEPADCLLITLKQHDFHRSLPQLLAPLKGSKPEIVCFQNGYGHLETLQSLLPEAAIWAAVTTEAAKRKSFTEVIHAGKGEVYIGKSLNGNHGAGQVSITANSLVEALNKAGFSAFLSNEVDTMIFRKLLINAVINPLTAIWRVPNGELPMPGYRLQLMKELYEEASSIFDACGISYGAHTWDDILQVCKATADNVSSMLADVLAFRPTEVQWINGSIAAMAEKRGLKAPLHRWICQVMDGMTVKER
ncbi:ketopantoate reductase family protein [Paenibacillus sp. NFR01]|uniref:ketopantoate reductase family protein n=1 Tax=Paenibacillus sp. NFR01 TaxID=1566279 RepID=UPI0008CAE47C|nr:2-dehydropantoate 2-reductase [Paenibacillus sp. NFR01]SET64367.1 2-dehydropantoate 2-reductase [Paenibacillus sp. NFR01]